MDCAKGATETIRPKFHYGVKKEPQTRLDLSVGRCLWLDGGVGLLEPETHSGPLAQRKDKDCGIDENQSSEDRSNKGNPSH